MHAADDPSLHPSFIGQLATILRRADWLLRPFILLLLASGLLVLCWVAYEAAPAGSFRQALASAALSTVLTLGSAGVLAVIAWRDRFRRAQERRVLRRFTRETWQESAIVAGAMRIPRMSIVASCAQGTPSDQRVTVEFIDATEGRPTDPLVEHTRRLWLPEFEEGARRGDYVFFDGETVDLVKADLSVAQLPGHRRLPHYTLTVASGTYAGFACSNANLDRTFVLEGESVALSLRQRWGVGATSILDVGRLPTTAVLGSGTVVVTSDNRLVLGHRLRTFIAGGASSADPRMPVHFVAEGLVPEDRDRNGRFSPLAGARRALGEEFNVGNRSENIAAAVSTIATGISFDQQRWQPYFTFLATLDTSWDEFQTAAATATDAWESERLLSLPFDVQHPGVRDLLLGRHPDLVLASNHAAAALWFALLFQHGYHMLRDELSN